MASSQFLQHEKNKLSRERGSFLVAIMDRRALRVLRAAIDKGAQLGIPLESIRSEYTWRERAVEGRGEEGHRQRRVVLANSDTGYPLRIHRQNSVLSIFARFLPPLSATRPPLSVLSLWRTRYHAHLSIHRLDVRGHESSVNACQVPRERRN